MDKRPIGVFDSGVGGLTVLKKLSRALPHEDIIYLGDTARVPYGAKSKETVTRFSIECVRFLKKHDIKLLVVACNTASSWALADLRKKFKFPVIGVIKPAAKEAALKTGNRKIGVIGTKATVNSAAYIDELKGIDKRIRVYQKACPLFVPLVEENWLKEKVTRGIALKYLEGLKARGIDTLILGCTHYPLLKPVIRGTLKKGTNIIDSAKSVSREIGPALKKLGLETASKRKGGLSFFVTDDPEGFAKTGSIFLKKTIKVKKVSVT